MSAPVLTAIKACGPRATNAQLEGVTGKGRRTVQRELSKLEASGRLIITPSRQRDRYDSGRLLTLVDQSTVKSPATLSAS
jgi:hypothetical protein